MRHKITPDWPLLRVRWEYLPLHYIKWKFMPLCPRFEVNELSICKPMGAFHFLHCRNIDTFMCMAVVRNAPRLTPCQGVVMLQLWTPQSNPSAKATWQAGTRLYHADQSGKRRQKNGIWFLRLADQIKKHTPQHLFKLFFKNGKVCSHWKSRVTWKGIKNKCKLNPLISKSEMALWHSTPLNVAALSIQLN